MTENILQKVVDAYMKSYTPPPSINEGEVVYDYMETDIFSILKSSKISHNDFVGADLEHASKIELKKAINNSPYFIKYCEKYKKLIIPAFVSAIAEKFYDDRVDVSIDIDDRKLEQTEKEEQRKYDLAKKSALRKLKKVNLTPEEKAVLGIK